MTHWRLTFSFSDNEKTNFSEVQCYGKNNIPTKLKKKTQNSYGTKNILGMTVEYTLFITAYKKITTFCQLKDKLMLKFRNTQWLNYKFALNWWCWDIYTHVYECKGSMWFLC